jgi:pyruvate formate lyase activating enzyme
MKIPEALFFHTEGGTSVVHCDLCPHRCGIRDGAFGLCRVRKNEGGKLTLPYYGRVSSLAMDPIEKKPLYHYRPGTEILSVGFVGCNLRCPFCQNWEISQSTEVPLGELPPEKLILEAQRRGSQAIAYTYSESLVHIEYLLEAMALARQAGIANVLVTNGCVLQDAAQGVLALTDAANVDIKAFSAQTYRHTLGGDLQTVLDFVQRSYQMGVHVEITTLVVPGLNDNDGEINALIDFIAHLSPAIPWHLSAYRPAYQYDAPPTSTSSLKHLGALAQNRLRYVYLGNVADEGNVTLCPDCGAPLVLRRGYRIDTSGLVLKTEGHKKAYFCAHCGKPAPIAY